MFDKQRFITRGIKIDVPPELVILLWQLIDERIAANHQLDYLQVFDLWVEQDSSEKPLQMIRHSQEVPLYQRVLGISDTTFIPIKAKIFAIDSGNYSTILRSNEY